MASLVVARVLEKMRQRSEEASRLSRKKLMIENVSPEKPDQPPMVLISCRVSMKNTRYMSRGNKRFLQEV